MNIKKLREDMISVGKLMYQKGFVASNDGNLSIRLDENRILITPSGVSKGFMKEEEMLIIDFDGNLLEGKSKPSSEYKMHLEVYKKRSDIKAVVHAHPPKATAFAVTNTTFDNVTLPEIVFSLGEVKLANYGTPTTNEIPEAVGKQLENTSAILLANHGALTIGPDIFDAYYKMETLEHYAAITIYARLIGREVCLDDEQVKKLYQIKADVYNK